MKNFEYKVINRKIGFFKFHKEATESDYQMAFSDFTTMVKIPAVDRFVVVVESEGAWNDMIEGLWLRTAELTEQYHIKKWGIVTPNSAIMKIALKRVVMQNNSYSNPTYDFYLSESESVIIAWIKV